MEEYRKASDKNPQDITFYTNMGDALFAENLYEHAFNTYGIAIVLDKYCLEAHYGKICVLIELEKYFEAAEQCNHAIKLIKASDARLKDFADLKAKIEVLQGRLNQ